MKEPHLLILACCTHHHIEKAIATETAKILNAPTTEFEHLPTTPPPQTSPTRRHFVIACEDLAIQWRNNNLRGVLIANAPSCYWWKAIEMREQNSEALEHST